MTRSDQLLKHWNKASSFSVLLCNGLWQSENPVMGLASRGFQVPFGPNKTLRNLDRCLHFYLANLLDSRAGKSTNLTGTVKYHVLALAVQVQLQLADTLLV